MPSSKAILRDIHDLGLNPSLAYTHTDGKGRVHDHRHKHSKQDHAAVDGTKKAEVKNALKEIQAVKPKVETQELESLQTLKVEDTVVSDAEINDTVEVDDKPKKGGRKKKQDSTEEV